MTLGVRDAIWAVVTVVGMSVAGVTGFYSAREGIVREIGDLKVEVRELRAQLLGLAGITIPIGPVPADTVSSGR